MQAAQASRHSLAVWFFAVFGGTNRLGFPNDGEAFSLSHSEGERAGVMEPRDGPILVNVPRATKTPHPDPLPFGRGEGRFSGGFPMAFGSTENSGELTASARVRPKKVSNQRRFGSVSS
jgi:hypothetical protein